MKRVQTVGQQYGRLLVLKEEGKWCLTGCACGKEVKVLRGNLLAGYAQSCGCLQKERTSKATFKHGHKKSDAAITPTYRSWRAMMNRCYNQAAENYCWYGAKGITVCTRWHDFRNFLADLGERPAKQELSRTGDAGNYEPGNCNWKTHKDNINEK